MLAAAGGSVPRGAEEVRPDNEALREADAEGCAEALPAGEPLLLRESPPPMAAAKKECDARALLCLLMQGTADN